MEKVTLGASREISYIPSRGSVEACVFQHSFEVDKCFHVGVADENAKTLLLHCLLPSCKASFCAPTVTETLKFTATRNLASLEPVLYSQKGNSDQNSITPFGIHARQLP